MSTYLLNINLTKTYGLCNQLYSIAGMCVYAIKHNIKYIFLNKFLKEINTDNYCNISEIIDINKTNLFLQKYGIVLFDSFNLRFALNHVKYGNEQFNIDVTSIIDANFKSNNCLLIKKNTNLNELLGDPFEYFNTRYGFKPNGPKMLYINFQIDDTIFNYKFDVNSNGSLNNDILIGYNFINDAFEPPLAYNDGSHEFIDILRNLTFHENLLNKANNYVANNIDTSKKVNTIHLRLENDAIVHWAKENNYDDLALYKKNVENKYIELIDKYINKDETTILICYDYNNAVVEHMEKNNYIWIKTPKMDSNRDVSAIIDMLIGQYCNKSYIFVYESSFSFTLLTRIYDKSNYNPIMFELNNLNKDVFILTK